MTPQELKSSILKLAIQGKLVEQRSEEGTGEELYQQIQEEKQSLIKAGKIKKEKPLPEITEDEVPFDIPDSWKWCRITECGEFISGYTPKPSELSVNGIIPYFKVSDMNTSGNELFLVNTSNYLIASTAKCFLKNTIVYPKNGGAVFTNKKRILAQNAVVDLNTGGYYPIAPLDLMFVYIFFSNIDFRKCYKGTALPTIDMDKLKNKLFPIPPLAEQKRIVAKIEELLPLIDRYEQAWSKLEDFNKRFPVDMQKSILQMAIQGKLVEQRPEEGTGEELFQQIQTEKQALIKAGKIKKEKPLLEITEDEIPFDIPESWKWVRIGSIFVTSSGTTPSKSNSEYYANSDYNWVRTTDLNNGVLESCELKISQKAFEECRLSIIPQDSVCIAMYGGAGTIGKNALIQFDTTINQSVCAIHPNGLCDMVFLQRFMQFYRPNWMKTAAGSRKDPNINQIIIKNALFPLPPLAEQKRIVAKLEEILPLCERLK